MIKGLAITPPVIGRISIGRVTEKNDMRLPEKDDQFTLTTQVQRPDGWVLHPLDAELRDQTESGKLRVIPVTLSFNDPELNFRAEYTLFDRTNGRPVCAGDGQQCRRRHDESIEQLPCPGPTHCAFGANGKCKPYGRLNVTVGDYDPLGTFIFRTTGFNSIRTLMARLMYFDAVSGGLLACMPLELRLRGKSTTQSHRAPIYYVDLGIREGLTLEQAIEQARQTHQARAASGYDQDALDQAARTALLNSEFEEDDEETPVILEEFYPETPKAPTPNKPRPLTLADKLEQRASAQ
ncbi:hypothetical protein [Marinimicrobium agarilyticum]|uniref:recombination directionality factor n=1 Tax=Marinimicrobium agarilyticum TaxID=306546 RepID=UPI000406C8E5|nr:hypothetical protein [Marinimicrobium agarilyticum]